MTVATRLQAKFKAISVQSHRFTPDEDPWSQNITLDPVYSSDASTENGQFWAATPAGRISLTITNPSAFNSFVEGQEYYVTFEPAS